MRWRRDRLGGGDRLGRELAEMGERPQGGEAVSQPASEIAPDPGTSFAFRPWVRGACRRAMIWGVGVVAALGLFVWLLRSPGGAPLGRAFGALFGYSFLFWITLAKIWWTAGRPALVVAETALGYQPLHTFSLRWMPFDRVLACSPRSGTSSLRVVHRASGDRARELFVNLGVIEGRSRLFEVLGERLEAAGLEPVAGRPHTWQRAEWEEPEIP